MKKVILFDLDGTLIDSTEAILEGFRVSFEKFGKTVPNDKIIKAEIGKPLEEMYQILGVEEEFIDSIVHAYKMHYRTIHTEKTTLLPNAKEAIVEASKFAKLGVVTTKTGKYSKEILEHLELMCYFETLIGREDVTYPKPHAEPILKALSKLQLDRTNVWMIGDTPMDILSAKNAGINSVAVTSGYAPYQTLNKYTSKIYNNVLDAIEYIKNYETNNK